MSLTAKFNEFKVTITFKVVTPAGTEPPSIEKVMPGVNAVVKGVFDTSNVCVGAVSMQVTLEPSS